MATVSAPFANSPELSTGLFASKDEAWPPGIIESLQIISKANKEGERHEATVKVRINGNLNHVVGEGRSPLNALNCALCRAYGRDVFELSEAVEKRMGPRYWQYAQGFCG